MGALSMMAIDNIRIEMSSPEPPVTDGSAKVFCELIEKAEPVQQEAERHIYAVDKAFSVYDNDRYIVILPYDGYRISFTSINSHPMLGTQYFDILLDKESFKRILWLPEQLLLLPSWKCCVRWAWALAVR